MCITYDSICNSSLPDRLGQITIYSAAHHSKLTCPCVYQEFGAVTAIIVDENQHKFLFFSHLRHRELIIASTCPMKIVIETQLALIDHIQNASDGGLEALGYQRD